MIINVHTSRYNETVATLKYFGFREVNGKYVGQLDNRTVEIRFGADFYDYEPMQPLFSILTLRFTVPIWDALLMRKFFTKERYSFYANSVDAEITVVARGYRVATLRFRYVYHKNKWSLGEISGSIDAGVEKTDCILWGIKILQKGLSKEAFFWDVVPTTIVMEFIVSSGFWQRVAPSRASFKYKNLTLSARLLRGDRAYDIVLHNVGRDDLSNPVLLNTVREMFERVISRSS